MKAEPASPARHYRLRSAFNCLSRPGRVCQETPTNVNQVRHAILKSLLRKIGVADSSPADNRYPVPLTLTTDAFSLDLATIWHIFQTRLLINQDERSTQVMKDYFSPNINEQSKPGTDANTNALCRSGSDADACISGSGCTGCNTGSEVSNCVQG